MTDVVLFSKNKCIKCEFTKQFFDKHGIAYDYLNIDEDDAALEKVLSLKDEFGISSMPVVTIEGGVDLSRYLEFEKPPLARFGDGFIFADFQIDILSEISEQLNV